MISGWRENNLKKFNIIYYILSAIVIISLIGYIFIRNKNIDKYEYKRDSEALEIVNDKFYRLKCELAHIKFRTFLYGNLDEFLDFCKAECDNYATKNTDINPYKISKTGSQQNVRNIIFDNSNNFAFFMQVYSLDDNSIIIRATDIKNPRHYEGNIHIDIVYTTIPVELKGSYDWIRQINDNIYFGIYNPPHDYDVDEIDNKILSMLNENN